MRIRLDRTGAMVKGTLLVALLALIGASLADYAWTEFRLRRATGGDTLGTVTFYYATPLKNGKLDIFYNQPQTEVCVYSLLPHAGYRPCWYAVRENVRTVS
jgi:hypothetical protein